MKSITLSLVIIVISISISINAYSQTYEYEETSAYLADIKAASELIYTVINDYYSKVESCGKKRIEQYPVSEIKEFVHSSNYALLVASKGLGKKNYEETLVKMIEENNCTIKENEK